MPHNEKVTLGTHRPPYANSADWMKSGGDFFKLLLTKARGKVFECFWCQKVALFSTKDTVNLCLNSPSKQKVQKGKKYGDNDFRSEKVANKSEKVTFFAKKDAFISCVIAPPTKT